MFPFGELLGKILGVRLLVAWGGAVLWCLANHGRLGRGVNPLPAAAPPCVSTTTGIGGLLWSLPDYSPADRGKPGEIDTEEIMTIVLEMVFLFYHLEKWCLGNCVPELVRPSLGPDANPLMIWQLINQPSSLMNKIDPVDIPPLLSNSSKIHSSYIYSARQDKSLATRDSYTLLRFKLMVQYISCSNLLVNVHWPVIPAQGSVALPSFAISGKVPSGIAASQRCPNLPPSVPKTTNAARRVFSPSSHTSSFPPIRP